MYLANTSIEGDQKYTCSRKLQADSEKFSQGHWKTQSLSLLDSVGRVGQNGIEQLQDWLTEGGLNRRIRNALVIWVTVRLSGLSLSTILSFASWLRFGTSHTVPLSSNSCYFQYVDVLHTFIELLINSQSTISRLYHLSTMGYSGSTSQKMCAHWDLSSDFIKALIQ